MAKEVKLCTHILFENLAKLGCKCANIMSLSTSSYHGGCRFISQFFRLSEIIRIEKFSVLMKAYSLLGLVFLMVQLRAQILTIGGARVEGCSNAGPTAPGQSGAPNGERQCWVHHHAACPGWWGSAHHVHTQLSS
ncbi:hypothetical protein BDL97_13G097000 [Sphagnum fallax]|nr:hypothetical protein BDL97_13G097000 [Sphagnum fallax]